MRRFLRPSAWACLLVCLQTTPGFAQDDRSDYPPWLERATVEIGIGDIGYLFSPRQLEPGYDVESVHVPDLAARLALGHRLNDRISLHLGYLRPARWVQYRNVNDDSSSHSVWMNVASASARARLPIGRRAMLYGEGGIGVVTRHGIEINGDTVVDDTVHPTPLVGAGVEYRLDARWGLVAGATFLPGRAKDRQPSTTFLAGGVAYHVTPRPPGTGVNEREVGATFHKHLIQTSLTTNQFGTRFNRLMAPIFWQGDVGVRRGVSLDYRRNVFHTKRIFSLDLGVSAAYKRSERLHDRFLTVSVLPLLRFTLARTPVADVYFAYSIAGPTFISKFMLDGHETGRHFTLHDSLGFGMYVGRGRHVNAELRIAHYSNGNLLPRNSGIQVPLTLAVGYAF